MSRSYSVSHMDSLVDDLPCGMENVLQYSDKPQVPKSSWGKSGVPSFIVLTSMFQKYV